MTAFESAADCTPKGMSGIGKLEQVLEGFQVHGWLSSMPAASSATGFVVL
ncbi:MAG: hypothetical protein WBO93_21295 [Gammaproteobacteria bacterium]|jgi:hypothetical protein